MFLIVKLQFKYIRSICKMINLKIVIIIKYDLTRIFFKKSSIKKTIVPIKIALVYYGFNKQNVKSVNSAIRQFFNVKQYSKMCQIIGLQFCLKLDPKNLKQFRGISSCTWYFKRAVPKNGTTPVD